MYNGIEVDMLNLGNADAILVTRWELGTPTRILIDGGDACDGPTVRGFLKCRGITYLDHIVCSHPHNDHAAGLVEVVNDDTITIGQAWMHLPWQHVDFGKLADALNRSQTTAKRVVQIVRASVQVSRDLLGAFAQRGLTPQEPFNPNTIGFLTVCGPTEKYYTELLQEFADLDRLRAIEESLASKEEDDRLDEILETTSFGSRMAETEELGGAPTAPENNSSTILATVVDGNKYLFTSDAGVPALTAAANAYNIAGLHWMQAPHHGSRRNLNKDLIAHFAPKRVFISAAGTRKHPRKRLVNALKEAGALVYSTHYPKPQNIWHHAGNVPSRPDYSTLPALYDAD